MIYAQIESSVECPYCGEPITLLVDPSVEDQAYIEDCVVCCQPITIRVRVAEDGRCRVAACREDDV